RNGHVVHRQHRRPRLRIRGCHGPSDLRLRRPGAHLDRARHPPRWLTPDRRPPRPRHVAGRGIDDVPRQRWLAQGQVEFSIAIAVLAVLALVGFDQLRGGVYYYFTSIESALNEPPPGSTATPTPTAIPGTPSPTPRPGTPTPTPTNTPVP